VYFAYAWSRSEAKNRTRKGVSRIPRTASAVRLLIAYSVQEYAKTRTPG